jgi:AraC-like DNA-binding protein
MLPDASCSRDWTPALGGCVAVRWAFPGELAGLRLWRCVADGEGLNRERAHPSHVVTMSFTGASEIAIGRRRELFAPAFAFVNAPGQEYATRHPWGCSCRGCHLVLAPEAFEEAGGRRLLAAGAPRTLMVAPRHLLRCRRLVRALSRPVPPERLGVEEELLAIVRGLFHGGGRPAFSIGRRPATEALHERCVQAARGLLEERFRERLGLSEIARSANASPDHLQRLFKRRTGLTLHRYQTRLRLVEALELVVETGVDLSSLAQELGFASHSHLTAAFRREFGLPPAALRRELRPRDVRGRREELRAALGRVRSLRA